MPTCTLLQLMPKGSLKCLSSVYYITSECFNFSRQYTKSTPRLVEEI